MKFIALLRGVNVGGKTIVKMERLREVLRAEGFSDVKTYIQSGNVSVGCDETDAAAVEEKLEALLEREFFKTPVVVRTADDIRRVLDENPFKDEPFEEKLFHVAFLKTELTDEQSALMEAQSNEMESYAARGREIYALLRDGVADSVLGKNFIERKLKVSATARNIRTVNKLLEL